MSLTTNERQHIRRLLRWAFEILQHLVPKPVEVVRQGGYTFRYRERMVEQAMVQKLARVISGLSAIEALSQEGFFQEQAALQRVHDELTEDIDFMCLALSAGERCATLEQLMGAFYAEPISERGVQRAPLKGPNSPPRKKIRARIASLVQSAGYSHNHVNAGATISHAYSSFVHGSSEAIMDMYDGRSGRFLVDGMQSSEFAEDHRADADNYYFRSVVAVAQVAMILEAHEVLIQVKAAHDQISLRIGITD
ncbi:hypothetical protein [Paracoccus aminovorans]|nr:hypothetical protein [Paracoccus aminovorans]